MWEAGQKTKQIYFWLTQEDAAKFSEALRHALPHMHWQCSHKSPNQRVIHQFDTLTAALECGRDNDFISQAFSPQALSAIQFSIKKTLHMTGIKDGYAPEYVFPSTVKVADHGHMAIRWNTRDADGETLAALNEQLNSIWKIFKKSTVPAKVHTLIGRPVNGFRIGKQMLDIARMENLFLRSNGPYCLID